MRDIIAEPDPRFVKTRDAAHLLGLSPRTLEKFRSHGAGPTFRKFGGRVVYAIADLEAWANRAACQSTSEPAYVVARAAGRVRPAGGASRPRR